MKSRNARAVCLAALFALSALMYAPNLNDYFQGDDFDLIHSFFDKPASYVVGLLYNDEAGSVWDYLCLAPDSGCPDPEHHGFLRPFKMWLLILDFKLWGTTPFGYHVTSTVFFVATVLFSFLILEQLLPRRRTLAFAGAAVVAMHPLFAGIVPSITYREETIASALALGCVFFFLRHRRSSGAGWQAHVCYALALLTKESTIVTLGFLAGYDLLDWLARRGGASALLDRLRFYIPVAPILAAYFGLRLVAFRSIVGGHGETDFLSIEGFLSFHSTLFAYLFTRPMLSFGGWPGTRPLTILVLLGLLAFLLAYRERLDADYFVRLLFVGPIWYAASTAIAHGIYFSPRHIVLPVIGLILCVALLVEGLIVVTRARNAWVPAALLLTLAAVAFLPPTASMSRRFSIASREVRATLEDIERETAHLDDGARVLIENLPALEHGPPPYFRYGLQSALLRPFRNSDVGRRLRIETGPGAGNYDLILRF